MQTRKIALACALLGTVTGVPLVAKASVVELVSQTPEATRAVTGFNFSGNTAFEADELQKVLVSKVGTPLDAENVRADAAALLKVYRDQGMVAQVTGATQDDKGVLVFTLVEAKILGIKLSGLVKVDESKVRPLITSQVNELFQAAKINADLKRCADSGLFEEVTDKVEEDPDVAGGMIFTFVFKEKEANQ